MTDEAATVFLAAWLWVVLVACVAGMFALAVAPQGSWTAICARVALIFRGFTEWTVSCGRWLHPAPSMLNRPSAEEDCFRHPLPCETAERPILNTRPALPNRRRVSVEGSDGVEYDPGAFGQWLKANHEIVWLPFRRHVKLYLEERDSSLGSTTEAPASAPTPASYSSTVDAGKQVVSADSERFRKPPCESARTPTNAPRSAAASPPRTDAPEHGRTHTDAAGCVECARWAQKCEELSNALEFSRGTVTKLGEQLSTVTWQWRERAAEVRRQIEAKTESWNRERVIDHDRECLAARLNRARTHAELDAHTIDQLNIEARELRDSERELARYGWRLSRTVESFLDWMDHQTMLDAVTEDTWARELGKVRAASHQWQDTCPEPPEGDR